MCRTVLTCIVAIISTSVTAQEHLDIGEVCYLASIGEATQQDVEDVLITIGSLRGDASLDGVVDFGDFVFLSANFGWVPPQLGDPANWSSRDFNCDGTWNFGDFLLMSANFGKRATDENVVRLGERLVAQIEPRSAHVAPVPEPDAWHLTTCWVICVALARRCRRGNRFARKVVAITTR